MNTIWNILMLVGVWGTEIFTILCFISGYLLGRRLRENAKKNELMMYVIAMVLCALFSGVFAAIVTVSSAHS